MSLALSPAGRGMSTVESKSGVGKFTVEESHGWSAVVEKSGVSYLLLGGDEVGGGCRRGGESAGILRLKLTRGGIGEGEAFEYGKGGTESGDPFDFDLLGLAVLSVAD